MRVGIFGGTFDPPHVGHLALAGLAVEQVQLDRLYWVLTPDPPHKRGIAITTADIRREMVEAVVRRNPHFAFSDMEFRRPGPHYAVDTVADFQAELPGAEIYYVMGEDSLDDLPTWHDPGRLVTLVDGVVVMERAGEEPDWPVLDQALPGLRSKTRVLLAPEIEVSSRQIRSLVRHSHPWQDRVDPVVAGIIERRQLYRATSA